MIGIETVVVVRDEWYTAWVRALSIAAFPPRSLPIQPLCSLLLPSLLLPSCCCAPLRQSGMTLLVYGCWRGELALVKTLLGLGANKEARDKVGARVDV